MITYKKRTRGFGGIFMILAFAVLSMGLLFAIQGVKQPKQYRSSAAAETNDQNTVVTPTPRTRDLNNDGRVGVGDLSILLSNFQTTNQIADINKDGTVTIIDLSILISNWTVS